MILCFCALISFSSVVRFDRLRPRILFNRKGCQVSSASPCCNCSNFRFGLTSNMLIENRVSLFIFQGLRGVEAQKVIIGSQIKISKSLLKRPRGTTGSTDP